jgi:hypothetical protein
MKETDTQFQTPTKPWKNKILQVINENFIEILLDMVNQNMQEALK